jgi:mannose-6-phosphate isomerase-like protein (cupin superfamily)
MHTRSIEQSRVNSRGGQTSFLLMGKGDFGSRNLALTWVDCPPGSQQQVHRHTTQEQVYVITRGRGLMIVGKEEQEVDAGTLVFVPPRTGHAIRNTSEELLTYVSATAPPFDPDGAGTSFAWRRN